MGVPSQKLRPLPFPLRITVSPYFPLRIRGIEGVTLITPLSPSYLKRGIFEELAC
jgi:hypothetical protein